jgi:hypothetical protein
MEVITYSSSVVLPQGTTHNATLTIQTNTNLEVLNATVYYIGNSLNISAAVFASLSDRNSDGIMDQVTFYFGDIVDMPNESPRSLDDTIIVQFEAVALDVSANVAGVQLPAIATFTHANGIVTANISVDVVEPVLCIFRYSAFFSLLI